MDPPWQIEIALKCQYLCEDVFLFFAQIQYWFVLGYLTIAFEAKGRGWSETERDCPVNPNVFIVGERIGFFACWPESVHSSSSTQNQIFIILKSFGNFFQQLFIFMSIFTSYFSKKPTRKAFSC